MGKRSKIERMGLKEEIGKVPDEEIAKRARLNKETVRSYRVRRRIPAQWLGETEVERSALPPLKAIQPEKPVKEKKEKREERISSQITTEEDNGGRTTSNGNVAANIITVHSPSQQSRSKSGSRVTLTIKLGDSSVLTLRGRAVHTLFRVLSAHYGRPIPKNGTPEWYDRHEGSDY